MIEQIKEIFKIIVIGITSVFVVLVVLLLIVALHTYKFFRKLSHGERFKKLLRKQHA